MHASLRRPTASTGEPAARTPTRLARPKVNPTWQQWAMSVQGCPLRAKLAVGGTHDPKEREADAVAAMSPVKVSRRVRPDSRMVSVAQV